MADKRTGEFETAMTRLDEIVKRLETESVSLDESVDLFKEGKKLAARCDELLKVAQETIAGANGAGAEPAAKGAPRRGDEDLPF
jgi:exodeoxyribonuclease VII small subunit